MKAKITITGMSEVKNYVLELEGTHDYGMIEIDMMIREGQSHIDNAVQRDFDKIDYEQEIYQLECQCEKYKDEDPALYAKYKQLLDESEPYDYLKTEV
jgi:hypothetical protein